MYFLVDTVRRTVGCNQAEPVSAIPYLSNLIHGMVLCVEQEYSLFEQNVNPMIAEKLTGERSRDYMMARRVAKENPPALSPLYESGAARPPAPRRSAVFYYARASTPVLFFL
jgi:hypothetical protein